MIRLRFKEAYTANIHCYNIQKHLSYEIFVSTLHPLITVDFQTNDYNMVDVDYRHINIFEVHLKKHQIYFGQH